MTLKKFRMKLPKWLALPGVMALFLVPLLAVPTARAPFQDYVPATQEVPVGYVNGTFPDNISESDDAYVLLDMVYYPPTTGYVFRVFYNWSGLVMTTGDVWQLVVECRATEQYGFYIAVLTPPFGGLGNYTYRLFCPPSDDAYFIPTDVDVRATCDTPFCDGIVPPPVPYTFWNLTDAEFAGGSPSVWFDSGNNGIDQDDFWIDHVVLRRIYTVAAPPPAAPLTNTVLSILLLILWIAFTSIGAAAPSGSFMMLAGFCGLLFAIIYILPTEPVTGIVVLGAAIMTLFVGIGIFHEAGA